MLKNDDDDDFKMFFDSPDKINEIFDTLEKDILFS